MNIFLLLFFSFTASCFCTRTQRFIEQGLLSKDEAPGYSNKASRDSIRNNTELPTRTEESVKKHLLFNQEAIFSINESKLSAKPRLEDYLEAPHYYVPQTIRDAATSAYDDLAKKERTQAGWQKKISGHGGYPWLSQLFNQEEDLILSVSPRLATKEVLPYWTNAEIKQHFQRIKDRMKSQKSDSSTKLFLVKGLDVKELHESFFGKNTDSHLAMLQLASQFNWLEATSPKIASVASYVSDPTQGPQACIETALASLLRKVLVTREKDPLPHMLENVLPKDIVGRSDFPRYNHGYLELLQSDQSDPSAEELSSLLKHIEKNIEKIIAIPQPVINERTLSEQIHVPCAAPSFQHLSKPPAIDSDAGQISKTLVVTQYKIIAMLAALLSRFSGKQVMLHLTELGLGAFKNPPEILEEALEAVLEIVQSFNVLVFVHAYNNNAVNLFQQSIPKNLKKYKFITGEVFKMLDSQKELSVVLNMSHSSKNQYSLIERRIRTNPEPDDYNSYIHEGLSYLLQETHFSLNPTHSAEQVFKAPKDLTKDKKSVTRPESAGAKQQNQKQSQPSPVQHEIDPSKYLETAKKYGSVMQESTRWAPVYSQSVFIQNKTKSLLEATKPLDAAAELVAIASHIEREVFKNIEQNPWNKLYHDKRQSTTAILANLDMILKKFKALLLSPKDNVFKQEQINSYQKTVFVK